MGPSRSTSCSMSTPVSSGISVRGVFAPQKRCVQLHCARNSVTRVSSSSPARQDSQDEGDEPAGPSGRELIYLDKRLNDSGRASSSGGSIDLEDTPEGITDVERDSLAPIINGFVSDQRDLVTLAYAVLIGEASIDWRRVGMWSHGWVTQSLDRHYAPMCLSGGFRLWVSDTLPTILPHPLPVRRCGGNECVCL